MQDTRTPQVTRPEHTPVSRRVGAVVMGAVSAVFVVLTGLAIGGALPLPMLEPEPWDPIWVLTAAIALLSGGGAVVLWRPHRPGLSTGKVILWVWAVVVVVLVVVALLLALDLI